MAGRRGDADRQRAALDRNPVQDGALNDGKGAGLRCAQQHARRGEVAEAVRQPGRDVGNRPADGEQRHANPRSEPVDQPAAHDVHDDRSEEHTSELQSLMRISYAVFCLKKKIINLLYNIKNNTPNYNIIYNISYTYTN